MQLSAWQFRGQACHGVLKQLLTVSLCVLCRLPEAAVPVLKFLNQTDFKIQDRWDLLYVSVHL